MERVQIAFIVSVASVVGVAIVVFGVLALVETLCEHKRAMQSKER